jgi:EpsD family peptidyl-prolyl cis-trans isomerase
MGIQQDRKGFRPAAGPLLWAVLASGVLGLSACGRHKSDEKPAGQVVARLDGEDITRTDVNAELEGTRIPPQMAQRDAEKLALQNIVTRRMLAKEAETRELTKTPQFALLRRRADEQLAAQTLARDIAAKVARPTRDEALAFMDAHPDMFAQRRLFRVDQIQFLRPANVEKLGLREAKTMEAVEQALKANNVEFRRQPGTIDSLTVNPDFIKEISAMLQRNPQELFMFATQPPGASAPVMTVNAVRQVDPAPLTGDQAIEVAKKALYNERVQKALAAEVDKQKAAAKTAVAYQAGWEPPAAPAGGKAPALPAKPALALPEDHPAAGATAAGGASPAVPAPGGG